MVLDVTKTQSGYKLARKRLRHDPGQGVPPHSDYNVFFYSDLTVEEVKPSSQTQRCRDKWNMFEENKVKDMEDADWDVDKIQRKRKYPDYDQTSTPIHE